MSAAIVRIPGIVFGGKLVIAERINLPDHAQVTVTIELRSKPTSAEKRQSLKNSIKKTGIHGEGKKFNRDDLSGVRPSRLTFSQVPVRIANAKRDHWGNVMTGTETTIPATFVDGVFKPEVEPRIAENTRVVLTVTELGPKRSPAEAWASFEARILARPVNSGGVRYTRDELHERR